MEYFALSNYLTITRIFTFEMAHVLTKHNGLCRNIHGHSYKLHVTLTGEVLKKPGSSDDGMLIDFKDLKHIVAEHIINTYDHALVINQHAPYAALLEDLPIERIKLMPFQPTCENLILHFAKLLVTNLPKHLRLTRLKLYETENSYAEWHA